MNITCLILILLAVILLAYIICRRREIFGGGLRKIIGGAAGRRNGAALKNLSASPRTKSEQRCIDVLEKTLGRPFPTAYPPWLRWRGCDGKGAARPMELDGYNEESGIALEFSGPLHTKHYPDKESYKSYFERVCKDMEKIRQCRENNVHLIVVDMMTPTHHLDAYIKSRLVDIGAADIRGEPVFVGNYISPQIADPYRNRPLEKELGLVCAGDAKNNTAVDFVGGAAGVCMKMHYLPM